MSERLGPETRAIIDAIDRLRKPSHENLNYLIMPLDLAVARVNELLELPGWFDHLTVGELTGTAFIRLNEDTKNLIDLAQAKTINSPIRRLYITNDAQVGATLTLAIGADASFTAEPLLSPETIFRAWILDEAGAGATLELSEAKTDIPTRYFVPASRQPMYFKKGVALRVHYRLNPTNAVTYTLRIYRANYADDYQSNLSLIYESATLRADDTDYDVEIEKPFILLAIGVFFWAIEWTAAPGVTAGFIEISGTVKK